MTQADDPLLFMAFGMYGAAMLQVQAFEAGLATLLAVASIGTAGSASWERRLRKTIPRNWHRFNKASASELLKLLDDAPIDLEEPLATNVKRLVRWRDFLAHRYLRLRLVSLGEPVTWKAEPETVVELYELGTAFAETNQLIHKQVARILNERPENQRRTSEAPDGVRRILEDVARQVIAPDVARFTRKRPTDPADQD